MNKLPYEVNDLIFKQLDKQNLINCLFVNKSFAKFIYKLIWSSISLKNAKILTKIWFEENDNNQFSNVVSSNLMFPYNEAVNVIECTYLNNITYDMERVINACKNVKYIIYKSSVIEKPILKFQRPLYQWEFNSNPNDNCFNNNQVLLKKIDKRFEAINFNNEWDDRTVTIEDINSSINTDANNFSQSTEIEEEINSCISPEVLESFVEHCHQLEEIIFLKNDICDKSLKQFMKCKNLKYLHINFEISSWDDEFTYEGFTKFIDFCSIKLQKLYIHSIKLLDKDMITYLVSNCPRNIYSIVLDSKSLTSQEVSNIIKKSNKLKELVIGSRFSKTGITKLPFDLNILYPNHELITSYQQSANTGSINYINPLFISKNSLKFNSIYCVLNKIENIQWLRNLTKFEYHFEKMESGLFEFFISVVKEMKNLEYLTLSGDVTFTNKNIFDLLLNLRNLKSLQLWIYDSSYNFNNFTNDNINREKNINNMLLSNIKFKLLKMNFSQHNYHININDSTYFNSNINSKILKEITPAFYNDFNLIEISSPFAFTSDCIELLANGVCPKLREISGYFNTDILPKHLQNVMVNLHFINTIFISNFQFEQNNIVNTITENYQMEWKSFSTKYKPKPTSLNTSINHFNELNEILISSHRMVLTFNESFINKFKQLV
ncbi:hypothetical protein BCR32DRAFT_266753 [Anaeromyces robustus]|uniref:F-box domain-containing protein n=1 Tax=Anaeromyces robustus TaxID=1754192 RepID=A0A1Y1XDG8_9FUNG|nr:hypothetical protein BCR32DRAFT_266753 [Anaeromyces robustus]|eukprot:ORX83798.1 hypothetical protein BCR32DRAFT_266753 [Anaeromyces robustus]